MCQLLRTGEPLCQIWRWQIGKEHGRIAQDDRRQHAFDSLTAANDVVAHDVAAAFAWRSFALVQIGLDEFALHGDTALACGLGWPGLPGKFLEEDRRDQRRAFSREMHQCAGLVVRNVAAVQTFEQPLDELACGLADFYRFSR